MPPKNIGTVSRRALRQLEERFVGVSASARHLRELVARVSATNATVLMIAEKAADMIKAEQHRLG